LVVKPYIGVAYRYSCILTGIVPGERAGIKIPFPMVVLASHWTYSPRIYFESGFLDSRDRDTPQLLYDNFKEV
jgi:hypothetical protein